MAHIFSLAIPASSAYLKGNRSGDQFKFPDSGFFKGFNKPSRLEADIFELETTGNVYYRPEIMNFTDKRIRFQRTSMAHFIEYNLTIASHRSSKRTYTSTATVRY